MKQPSYGNVPAEERSGRSGQHGYNCPCDDCTGLSKPIDYCKNKKINTNYERSRR